MATDSTIAIPTKRVLIIRSEEHTSELQSHSFISYAVFCLKKKKKEQYKTDRKSTTLNSCITNEDIRGKSVGHEE